MTRRRVLSVLLALSLMLTWLPPASAAPVKRAPRRIASKAQHQGGTQITLSGKLKITKLKDGAYLAALALDEPADFLSVVGDDLFIEDYFRQTSVLAQLPNQYNGKKVRVSGTLGVLPDPLSGIRKPALLAASASVIPPVKSVSLNKKSASVRMGETLQLVASIKPATASKKLQWSVSKSSVARVNQDGLITPLMKGSVVVTCKAGGKKAECKLNVLVPVAGVSLPSASIRLKKGASATLKPSILPSDASNKKIVWASSDTAVASVSSKGKLTAKAQGVALVTATTSDGAFSAECDVLVDQNPVPVVGVTLDPGELSLQPGETKRLSAVIAPTDATDPSVRWFSSDSSIASVNGSGLVTANALGSCEITAKTNDGALIAVCQLSVATLPAPPEIIKLRSVDVTPKQFQLSPGGTQQLGAQPLPAEAELPPLTWSSLDPTLASVDKDGLVTAKKKGLVILMADSGLKDDSGEPIIGTAVCVISGTPVAPFAPAGVGELQVARGGVKVQMPILYADVNALMPGGDPEEMLNEETGKTELHLNYDADDSVLVFIKEGGSYVFDRYELGDISVKTARGLIVLNTATKMLTTYGMPDKIVGMPGDECISCSYYVDSGGTRMEISFMIDYTQSPQLIIGCSVGVAH